MRHIRTFFLHLGLLAAALVIVGTGPAEAKTIEGSGQPPSQTFTLPAQDGTPRTVTVGPSGSPVSSPQNAERNATSTTQPPPPAWQYQTELVSPTDLTSSNGVVTQVQLSVRASSRGCSDPESCTNGVRGSTGYTWFHALDIEVGANADQNVAGLHAGIALGGSGQSSQWYFDWSGYYGPDTPNLNGNVLGPSLGHNIHLVENHWYQILIKRVSCGKASYGWGASIQDSATKQWTSAGRFCVPNADRIAKVYYFTEIIEHDVCTTDFYQGEDKGLSYSTADQKKMPFPDAAGVYVDNSCTNTNLSRVKSSGSLDQREVVRGSNGGITASYQNLW